jgi:polyhydroxyalkanoate synthase
MPGPDREFTEDHKDPQIATSSPLFQWGRECARPESADGAIPPWLQERWLRFLTAILDAEHAPVGLTPKTAIWRKNKATLYRYHGPQPPRYPIPLLLVYALINRPYVMDLRPGQSLVEYLVNQGFDVFLLDWGDAEDEDAALTLDDLVAGYLPLAVRRVSHASGAEQVSMLGYCMGGTLAALYAATHANAPDGPLRNLICLASPIDFAAGETPLHVWLRPEHFDVHALVDTLGNVPPIYVDLGTRLLRPIANTIGGYANLWAHLDDPEFIVRWQAMHRWLNDGVVFPGAAFRQWITNFYQENRLIRDALLLRHRRVRLARITASLLVIAAQHDYIVPVEQVTPLLDHVGSIDRELLVLPGGHVGLVTGRVAERVLWEPIVRWLAPRSQPRACCPPARRKRRR